MTVTTPKTSAHPAARTAAALALVLAAALPTAASAHRAWMLPSATVLSGDEPWVTVDAAVSNDLFYFEHVPLRLDGLAVVGPDGAAVKPENTATGKYRSTFDVKLAKPGTYKLAVVNDNLMASYKVGSETKRARGTAETLQKEIPAHATDVNVTRSLSRLEVFVTSGKPNEAALKPTGAGLELVPVTHPNDLVAGDQAAFRFVDDGQPAANVEVTVIPGGNRYRDALGEFKVKTDAEGKFSVKWPGPGMYWINASSGAAPRGAGGPAGTIAQPTKRTSYSATLEVLP